MLSTILLSLVPALPPTPPTPLAFLAQEEEGAAEAKIAECGEDVAKLEALAASFEEAEDDASARLVYERIIEVSPDHEAAHKALRHHQYDGKWFESYAALSKYRRAEAKRMKEEFGKVRYNDEWVLEVDLPYLRMGWEKQGDGSWVNPAEVEQAKKVAEYTEQGYKQRAEDSTWVHPDDFQQWTDNLYRIGEDWVTEAEANAFHGEVGQWWKHQGEHFTAYSTCSAEANRWVLWWADQVYADMVRLYGVEPDNKPIFACLNSMDQYNTFAAGSQELQLPSTESGGFSSCHYAYFADIWFDISNQTAPQYVGGGVAYYDVDDPQMNPWGQYAVRHAAALSYAENIDRSWNTISQFISNQGGGGPTPDALWVEKKIPRWMVYGGASYVERYRRDRIAEDNGGDPWAVRNWAIEQLKAGGPIDLEAVFQMALDINDLDGSTRLINVTGAVVGFIMDGGVADVEKAHAGFKTALQKGEGVKEAVVALQDAVIANREAFDAYAPMPELAPYGRRGRRRRESARRPRRHGRRSLGPGRRENGTPRSPARGAFFSRPCRSTPTPIVLPPDRPR
jgi:hypothetical protein